MSFFHPPSYIFQGHLPFTEMEALLTWLDENGRKKRSGIEWCYYAVKYGDTVAIGSPETRGTMSVEVTISDSAVAAMFRLRWVTEKEA